MKKLILLALLTLLVGHMLVQAQCDQKVVLTSSKTQYLDADFKVQRSVDENTVIEISGSNISISPADHTMTGTISSNQCDWKIPFKEGKSVLKAALTENGDSKAVTLTITGKDGKVTFLAELDGEPDTKIMVVADTFGEKK